MSHIYRVLSVRQPWATALVTPVATGSRVAVKPIENRTWRVAYRGLVLIHASAAKPTMDDHYAVSCGWPESAGPMPNYWKGYQRSAIIGVATLVGIASDLPTHDLPRDEKLAGDWLRFCQQAVINLEHWADGPEQWLFIDPIPFANPISYPGALNLWRPNDKIVAAAKREIELAKKVSKL